MDGRNWGSSLEGLANAWVRVYEESCRELLDVHDDLAEIKNMAIDAANAEFPTVKLAIEAWDERHQNKDNPHRRRMGEFGLTCLRKTGPVWRRILRDQPVVRTWAEDFEDEPIVAVGSEDPAPEPDPSRLSCDELYLFLAERYSVIPPDSFMSAMTGKAQSNFSGARGVAAKNGYRIVSLSPSVFVKLGADGTGERVGDQYWKVETRPVEDFDRESAIEALFEFLVNDPANADLIRVLKTLGDV